MKYPMKARLRWWLSGKRVQVRWFVHLFRADPQEVWDDCVDMEQTGTWDSMWERNLSGKIANARMGK